MTNSIEVRGLCKSYGDFALRNVDLTLPAGSILGLIGENGAGKTTTIKCILNLVHRDGGEITLMGCDNIRQERLAKQDIGVVLDECFFHDSLRPRDIEDILRPVFPAWDSRLFRRYLNCSTYEYLTSYRISKAKELLISQPSLEIQDIAHRTGFSDSSHFIAIFKKSVGVTPLEFRRMN